MAVEGMSAALIQLIPSSELAPGQAATIRNELMRSLISKVSAALKLSPDKLVVRDVRAKDDIALYSAGSASAVEDWGCVTGTTANAYEDLATGTMADQRWIGFYGVTINEGCAATALKFNIGGADRVIWQLQALKSEDDMTGLCPAGAVIPPSSPYTISRFVRVTSGPAFIVLKGFVVEPRGKVLSP